MIADALADLRARLASAGGADVVVVAVTKGFPAATVTAAIEAGVGHIAESYAQEAVEKLATVRAAGHLGGICVHFIGRLQTNKVRILAPWIDRWDSVDRSAVIDEIARRQPGAHILIQVNATGEADKGGAPPSEVEALLESARGAGLVVEGLMTVGPTQGGPGAARAAFEQVRSLVDRFGLSVCSMGMSDDLEVAVAAGSTEVRVGSALFGTRP